MTRKFSEAELEKLARIVAEQLRDEAIWYKRISEKDDFFPPPLHRNSASAHRQASREVIIERELLYGKLCAMLCESRGEEYEQNDFALFTVPEAPKEEE